MSIALQSFQVAGGSKPVDFIQVKRSPVGMIKHNQPGKPLTIGIKFYFHQVIDA